MRQADPKAFSRSGKSRQASRRDTAGAKWAWSAPKRSALRQSSQASFSQLHPPSGWGQSHSSPNLCPFCLSLGSFSVYTDMTASHGLASVLESTLNAPQECLFFASDVGNFKVDHSRNSRKDGQRIGRCYVGKLLCHELQKWLDRLRLSRAKPARNPAFSACPMTVPGCWASSSASNLIEETMLCEQGCRWWDVNCPRIAQ